MARGSCCSTSIGGSRSIVPSFGDESGKSPGKFDHVRQTSFQKSCRPEEGPRYLGPDGRRACWVIALPASLALGSRTAQPSAAPALNTPTAKSDINLTLHWAMTVIVCQSSLGAMCSRIACRSSLSSSTLQNLALPWRRRHGPFPRSSALRPTQRNSITAWPQNASHSSHQFDSSRLLFRSLGDLERSCSFRLLLSLQEPVVRLADFLHTTKVQSTNVPDVQSHTCRTFRLPVVCSTSSGHNDETRNGLDVQAPECSMLLKMRDFLKGVGRLRFYQHA